MNQPDTLQNSPNRLTTALVGGAIAGAILLLGHAFFIRETAAVTFGDWTMRLLVWPAAAAAVLGGLSVAGSFLIPRIKATDLYREFFEPEPIDVEGLRESHRWTLTGRSPEIGSVSTSFSEGAVEGSGLTIGRSRDARVKLRDGSISREHARLTIGENGELMIVDLASGNGVTIPDSEGRDRFISPHSPHPVGATFKLGEVEFIIEDRDAPEVEPEPEPAIETAPAAAKTAEAAIPVAKPAPVQPAKPKPSRRKPRRRRKKSANSLASFVLLFIVLAILAAGAWLVLELFGPDDWQEDMRSILSPNSATESDSGVERETETETETEFPSATPTPATDPFNDPF